MEEVQVGTGRKLKDGADLAVLTLGPLGTEAAKAIEEVEQKTGRSIAHYDMRFLKPLDEDLLTEVVQKFRCIVTVEDGVRAGGFGSAVLEWVADRNADCRVVRLGLPDEFVEHGSVPELRALVGLDAAGIARTILNIDL